MRDSQRKRVYRAEWKLSSNGEVFPDLKALEKRARKITMSKWWAFHFGQRSAPPIVERGRGGKATASGSWKMTFGKKAQNMVYLCHELAHIATPGKEHGPEFVRAYLLLLRRYAGKEIADELKGHLKTTKAKRARKEAHAIRVERYGTAIKTFKPRVVYEDPQPQESVTDVSQTPEQMISASPGAPLDYT